MITSLRDERKTTEQSIRLLRDGSIVMVPLAYETREGKLVSMQDFLSDPTNTQQIFGTGQPGDHPTWVRSLTPQSVPIPKAQLHQAIASMAIMWFLELDLTTDDQIEKFANSVKRLTDNIIKQSSVQRDSSIAKLTKRQASIDEAINRLVSRRDILEDQNRSKVRASTPASNGSANANWNRTWKTSWGDTVIQASGGGVNGTFTHKDGKLEGTVSANGLVITGKWTQGPNRTPPYNAGAFEFTLAADGRSYTGRWWYGFDTSKKADGGWSGTAK